MAVVILTAEPCIDRLPPSRDDDEAGKDRRDTVAEIFPCVVLFLGGGKIRRRIWNGAGIMTVACAARTLRRSRPNITLRSSPIGETLHFIKLGYPYLSMHYPCLDVGH
jgi:hypothetical protein